MGGVGSSLSAHRMPVLDHANLPAFGHLQAVCLPIPRLPALLQRHTGLVRIVHDLLAGAVGAAAIPCKPQMGANPAHGARKEDGSFSQCLDLIGESWPHRAVRYGKQQGPTWLHAADDVPALAAACHSTCRKRAGQPSRQLAAGLQDTCLFGLRTSILHPPAPNPQPLCIRTP